MTPADFMPEMLIAWGGAAVFNQALGMARRNQVLEGHWDGVKRICSGKLDISSSWPMPVSFVLDEDGTVHSHCPCRLNQEEGRICPHVLALAIYLMVTFGSDEDPAPVSSSPVSASPVSSSRVSSSSPVSSSPVSSSSPFIRTIPDKPVIHCFLAGSRVSLSARLTALYPNGMRVICQALEEEACFHREDPHDDSVLYVRNHRAETKARECLLRRGFSPFEAPVSSSRDFSGDKDRLVVTDQHVLLNFLGGGIPYLRRLGWKVELAEFLEKLYDAMDMVVPVVDVRDAPSGAFDVSCSYEVQGRAIPEQLVRGALARGDAYMLTDGVPILIDAEAIKSMRAVLADCPASAGSSKGSIRIPALYAPYVRAAFASFDAIALEDASAPHWRETAMKRNREGAIRFEPIPLGSLEGTLRPYQKDGVYWMRFLEKSGLSGLLADEMGLGKTLQTLTWLSLERVDPAARGKPALVVCPTSLVRNWEAEAARFTPQLRTLVVSGADRADCFSQIPKADLVITSYALLQRDLEVAYAACVFSVVVLDEAQHVKNRTTRNAQSVKCLQAVQKLVLTGTPVENSVADVWSIFDFLLPGYLGDYERFREDTERPIAEGGELGSAAQEKLHRKLHPFVLRRLKRDVAKDLPDKIVTVAYAPLSERQRAYYDRELLQTRGKIRNLTRQKGFSAARFEILALLMRLRQLSSHLVLSKDWRERHTQGALPPVPAGGSPTPNPLSGKLDVFFERLEEQMAGGHRTLVFSQFVTMLSILRQELDARGIAYCYLDGATKNRLEECRRFNANDAIPLFLISLHAGGTGLNLTGADVVMHFDPWWNPAVEDQATDRAHRIGQKKTVSVIKLIAESSVEERVLALQRKKQLVIDATIGTTDEAVMNALTYDDIREIVGL